MHAHTILAAGATLLLSVGLAHAQDVSFGQRLFQEKADCQFCHGPEGDGRGDPRSPGKAANLHETKLDRAQLIEVITCGRPGQRDAAFRQIRLRGHQVLRPQRREQVGQNMPPFPHSTSLTQREIAAVADYILATFVGK